MAVAGGKPGPLPVALWVIPVSGLGGVARHVLDAASAGIPGYQLVVLTPEGPLAEELRRRGTRVAVGRFGPEAGTLASIRALRTAAGLLRPTVVHSHLAYADVIVAATPLPADTARVTTEHGIAGNDQVYHRTASKSKVMARVHSIRLRRFDAVVAVAEATKQAMLEKWAPRQPVQVIYNGVDPVGMSPKRRGGGPLRILTLARLAPEKRIPQLLRAFKLALAARPDAKLTVAGVGDLDHELKALAVELGVSHAVDFPGFIEPEAAMREANVLAQLSVWENCSYSLLDAANHGLRVVASSVGGNPEVVEARGLVDADDIESVAAALLDDHTPASLGNWPSVRDMTTALARVYEDAVASHRRPRASAGVALATNNGDVGGGEVMLLNIADALRALDVQVTIVGPSEPGALVAQAREAGHLVVALEATNRIQWMRALRKWDQRTRQGVLWCNGLVPAAATALRPGRVVHLHQRPLGVLKLIEPIAKFGALAVLVPSKSMAEAIRDATVMPNWSGAVSPGITRARGERRPFVLGFLGRPSVDKGVHVLAQALGILDADEPGGYRLLLAGEPRFVSDSAQQEINLALESVADLVDRPGWIPPADFFGQIDLLVVPSIWPEPFGLVVTEAMSAGVPVITSDAGALPTLLHDPGDTFLRGDAQALARTVVSKRTRGLNASVDANRARWAEHFSPAAGQRSVASLLERVGLRLHR